MREIRTSGSVGGWGGKPPWPTRHLDQEQAELLSFLLFVVPGIVEDLVQVFQPVAATFDVENVALVQEAIEDGGRHDLVAGENFWPVLD